MHRNFIKQFQVNLPRTVLFCLLAVLVFGFNATAQKQPKSKIINVTVYRYHASITREMEVNAVKGLNTVVLNDLPGNIDDQSFRITRAAGKIRVVECQLHPTFTPRDSRQMDEKKHADEIAALRNIILEANDRITVLEAKRKLVESLKTQYIKIGNEKLASSAAATADFKDLLDYIDSNLSDILAKIRQNSRASQQAEADIKALNESFESTRTDNGAGRVYEAKITFKAEKQQKTQLQFTYTVNNAEWKPSYDLRVNSENKTALLQFYGNVTQETGEDWNNVNLSLSSSGTNTQFPDLKPADFFLEAGSKLADVVDVAPGMTNTHPNLQITYGYNSGLPAGTVELKGSVIDEKTAESLCGTKIIVAGTNYSTETDIQGRYRLLSNLPPGTYVLNATYIGFGNLSTKITIDSRQNSITVNWRLAESNLTCNYAVVTAKKPDIETNETRAVARVDGDDDKNLNFESATVRTLANVYEIPQAANITTDGESHKLLIAERVMPISMQYSTLPRLVPSVFMMGNLVNDTSLTFPGGQVSVFVDNDFINTIYSADFIPSDTMKATLGVDNNIKVEKKLVKKFTELPGVFSSSTATTFHYEIILTNLRKTTEKVTVMDNFPVSNANKVTVERIEPAQDKNPDNANGKLVWNIELKPGETKTIPVKFKVIAAPGASYSVP